jgi:flagellar hook-length control protein FliK
MRFAIVGIVANNFQSLFNADNVNKNSKKDLNNDYKTNNFNIQNSQTVTMLKANILKAKESLKHFTLNLKEAIENYKPPISKLSMELHPKELGKVEVTIVNRGNNLQIQINSNNTAISFFHSTQQELRQNLINMGFTDVNMSFNQNQQQGNKEYKQNQKFFKNENEEYDEMIIEIPYQYA